MLVITQFFCGIDVCKTKSETLILLRISDLFCGVAEIRTNTIVTCVYWGLG